MELKVGHWMENIYNEFNVVKHTFLKCKYISYTSWKYHVSNRILYGYTHIVYTL